jgi:hypothetical protein
MSRLNRVLLSPYSKNFGHGKKLFSPAGAGPKEMRTEATAPRTLAFSYGVRTFLLLYAQRA